MDNQIIKGDEIDIVALFKTLWNDRKFIYYSVGVCCFFGLIISIASPVKYTAAATLLPSAENEVSSLGGLSSLAGLAGVNLGSMMGNNTGISPDLYPQVVQSKPFLLELVDIKLSWESCKDSLTLREKMTLDRKNNFGEIIFKYTLGLPGTLKNALFPATNENNISNRLNNDGYYTLTEDEFNLLKSVESYISVDVDKKTGLVTLAVTLEEPLASAQLATSAIRILQKQVIDYKTQKAVDNLHFLQSSYNDSKKDYENAQKALYEFTDENRFVINERVNPDYQLMKDAYDISSTVYKSLSEQLEQAKIIVKQVTPVFKVLEPVVVPIEKSAPKRTLIVIAGFILGLFIGVGFILGKIFRDTVQRKLNMK